MDTLNVIFLGISLFVVSISATAVLLRKNPALNRWKKRYPSLGWFFDLTIGFSSGNSALGRDLRWAWLLFVVLIAIGARVWDFGAHPGGFNQDEAMAAVDAKALADYGTDRLGMRYPVHFTAWGYGQMSVLMSYLMIPGIKIWGLNAVTARLPSLLISLTGLVFLFLLNHFLFGKKAAWVVSAFAAINPWHIMQSRWALDCNLYPHFFIAGLYFLCRAVQGPIRFLYLAMLLFAISMYSYGVAFVSMPFFLLIAAFLLWKKTSIPAKHLILSALTYMVVSSPIYLTMFINAWRLSTIETPFFTIPRFPDSIRSADLLFFSADTPQQLMTNFQSLWKVVFRQDPDLPWNALDRFGTIYQFSLPFTILGIFYVIKQASNRLIQSRQVCLLLFISAFLAALWSGLIVASVNVNRINLAFYFTLSLTALGIYQVSLWTPRLHYLPAFLYMVAFAFFLHAYFWGEYRAQIAELFFSGFREALLEAASHPHDRLYITEYTQGPQARQVSEILTQFHLNLDSRGTPPKAIQYADFSNFPITPGDSSIYVVHQNELDLFPQYSYVHKQFSQFYVVYPRPVSASSQP